MSALGDGFNRSTQHFFSKVSRWSVNDGIPNYPVCASGSTHLNSGVKQFVRPLAGYFSESDMLRAMGDAARLLTRTSTMGEHESI